MIYFLQTVLINKGITTPIVTFKNIFLRNLSNKIDIDHCFSVLGLRNDSDQETVRQKFLLLVKKYHPDSGCPEADQLKFQEIEACYRQLQQKFAKDRYNTNEGAGEYGLYYKDKIGDVQEFDIKHTAPQHRQYLNFSGIGSGTPFQREKQFAKYRAEKAIDNINTYRVNKLQDPSESALMKKDTKKRAKDIKTGLGLDRLVEDLIQESMARGEFDNLSGSGKPLKMNSRENPYVDFVTHKMNQVLIENGFIPTWILYQKEIRERSSKILDFLRKERSKLGPNPLKEKENIIWAKIKSSLNDDVHILNDKINTYNLMVPILGKQMLLFNLDKESNKILEEGYQDQLEKPCEKSEKPKKKETLFESLIYFLRSSTH